jgi:hypothetical protein
METCQQSFSRAFATSPQDEIVISGIAGRFPKSANVTEFADNLYNKVGCWKVEGTQLNFIKFLLNYRPKFTHKYP